MKATNRIRREYLDQDYIDKLTPEEKKWLSNFNEEWLGANFNHGGEVLHKKKAQKREIYNRNNARNRCVLSVSKAQNRMIDNENLQNTPESEEEKKNVSNTVEDTIIELIDRDKKD